MQATIQERAQQSEAIARASIARISNDKLAQTWMDTNDQPMNRPVVILRGWLLDELENRMDAADLRDAKSPYCFGPAVSRFDRWMSADSSPAPDAPYVSPINYLR